MKRPLAHFVLLLKSACGPEAKFGVRYCSFPLDGGRLGWGCSGWRRTPTPTLPREGGGSQCRRSSSVRNGPTADTPTLVLPASRVARSAMDH